MPIFSTFREIWLVDFEFDAQHGERPAVLCMVARELGTDRLVRLWADDLKRLREAPFGVGPTTLFVAYYASAELGCFLSLGWPMPVRVLDLYVEFRNLTNGRRPPNGNGLLGALAWHGLDAIGATEKDELRQLALRGGEYSEAEQLALLDYCETDVNALLRLLKVMAANIDLPRALLRGRYMAAAARIESTGVPIDVETLSLLRDSWETVQDALISDVDREYSVYEGRTFKADRWAAYLESENIPWPLLPSGRLALDDDTFRQMAKRHPEVAQIRELRHSLGQLRLNDLAVGDDGRNRVLLSAFAARTSRNQPSNSRFIFGPSCWLRGLIKPHEGRAIAYIDWEQQEFGIAAALSDDASMKQAYESGDPYLAFAKQAGAVPNDATKESHPRERGQFKVCALAVQYGMGSTSLAQSLGEPDIVGRELLSLHQRTYPSYWLWSQAAVNHAMLFGWLQTAFGWRIQVGPEVSPRSLANFPCQANGAEMLRLACCLATERGIAVCAPVHDALLVEGSVDEIEEVVAATQHAMREASEIVLDGFALRSDTEIVRYPDRYMDPRGTKMWETVTEMLKQQAGAGLTQTEGVRL